MYVKVSQKQNYDADECITLNVMLAFIYAMCGAYNRWHAHYTQ